VHVAIDGRELLGRPTGVGRYLGHLLRVWSADPGFPHRLSIVTPSTAPESLRALAPRASWHPAPARSAGTWWEQTRLPAALRALRPDVFFAPAYTAPIRLPCPLVLVVHDVSYFAHPEWFGAREGFRRRWLTRASVSRAARVLTVSEFSAAEIARWLPGATGKIVVAHHGAPPAAPPAHRQPEPVILYVGSLFARRHIPDLISAFADVVTRVPAARLVLVGDDRGRPAVDPRRLAADAGHSAAVEWHAYVDDQTLDALYGTARVFAFLSAYEGFALTPLEAIARGVPAVLLDTAVAREVYADGAAYVPLDRAAIATALTELLQDDAAHAALAVKGQARLQAFSWARAAALARQAVEDAAP
jgi:glycosyltransferase involved in cell wall biosynthesis